MSATKLQKWGNSVGLRIPAPTLRSWGVAEGHPVRFTVVGSALMVEPANKRYTLAELLAQCDLSQPMSSQEREWIDTKPVGLEEI
jgi:antitoxin ChpS